MSGARRGWRVRPARRPIGPDAVLDRAEELLAAGQPTKARALALGLGFIDLTSTNGDTRAAATRISRARAIADATDPNTDPEGNHP